MSFYCISIVFAANTAKMNNGTKVSLRLSRLPILSRKTKFSFQELSFYHVTKNAPSSFSYFWIHTNPWGRSIDSRMHNSSRQSICSTKKSISSYLIDFVSQNVWNCEFKYICVSPLISPLPVRYIWFFTSPPRGTSSFYLRVLKMLRSKGLHYLPHEILWNLGLTISRIFSPSNMNTFNFRSILFQDNFELRKLELELSLY